MKKKVFITLGLCFALNLTLFSQDSAKHKPALSLKPFAGAGLFNSSWGPSTGFAMRLVLPGKTGNPFLQLGADYMLHSMATLSNGKFSEFSTISSYDVKLMINTMPSSPAWFGISIGMVRSANISALDKKFKAGIVAERNHLGFSADFLRDANKQQNTAVTIKYYF